MDEGYTGLTECGWGDGQIATPELRSAVSDALASLPTRLTSAVALHLLPGLVDRNAVAASRPRLVQGLGALESNDRLVGRLVELLTEDAGSGYEDFTLELLARGEDPQQVARTLLEPAARSIGAAWCADTQDFVNVTFAVSRLQRLFWKLVSDNPPPRRAESHKLALLAPTPGEQHTFGLSIVEDALRRAGWEVDCCRCGEEAEMFRLVATNKYRFVGLSLSGEALMPAFTSAIGRLRARSRNRSVSIVAGGSLFLHRPEMAIAAGADFAGGNARAIVRLAESVLAADQPSYHVSVAAE